MGTRNGGLLSNVMAPSSAVVVSLQRTIAGLRLRFRHRSSRRTCGKTCTPCRGVAFDVPSVSRVPDIQARHVRRSRGRFPGRSDDLARSGAGLFIETPGTAGDCETATSRLRSHSKRPWQRLVEVVEVEDEGTDPGEA